MSFLKLGKNCHFQQIGRYLTTQHHASNLLQIAFTKSTGWVGLINKFRLFSVVPICPLQPFGQHPNSDREWIPGSKCSC